MGKPSLCGCMAGKGIVGWAAASEQLGEQSPAKASPAKGPGSSRDVKVVLGNKQMMADEGVAISKAVDDYMRDMEVGSSSVGIVNQAAALPLHFCFPLAATADWQCCHWDAQYILVLPGQAWRDCRPGVNGGRAV